VPNNNTPAVSKQGAVQVFQYETLKQVEHVNNGRYSEHEQVFPVRIFF